MAEPCPHRGPSACLLTALPVCCACQDNRPHASAYRVYIDGVGFVQRGTRWQYYCWQCQKFWASRVSASGLELAQTRIPETPDLAEYLRKWSDYQRGYMTVPDGPDAGRRIILSFDSWDSVPHGRLPKVTPSTRQELLEHGGEYGMTLLDDRGPGPLVPSEEANVPHQDLDAVFDELLEGASDSESSDTRAEQPILSEEATSQNTRTPSANQHDEPATLTERQRQARERAIRVFGTLEDIERDDYESPVAGMFNRYWGRYRQVQQDRQLANDLTQQEGGADGARAGRQETVSRPQVVATALEIESRIAAWRAEVQRRAIATPTTDANGVVTEGGAATNSEQVATIEQAEISATSTQTVELNDVLQSLSALQADMVDFASPFSPRQFTSASSPSAARNTDTDSRPRDADATIAAQTATDRIEPVVAWYQLRERYQQDGFFQVPPAAPDPPTSSNGNDASTYQDLTSLLTRLDALHISDPTRRNSLGTIQEQASILSAALRRIRQWIPDDAPQLHLDNDAKRPPPLSDEEIKVACQICYSQNATQALIPCGHMVMCEYCADIQIPTRKNDKTLPAEPHAKCPMCRKKVKSRHRIHY